MIEIAKSIYIFENEIQESFARSPKPGGQHVNKVESKVVLRFDAKNSAGISPFMLRNLRVLAGRRMTKRGILTITSNRNRRQIQNRSDAREKMINLLKQSAQSPKTRLPTKPSKASNDRRLTAKKRNSEIKKSRNSRSSEL